VSGAQVVQRWWDEVWGAGDLDVVDEIIAPTYVRHGPTGTVTRDHAGLKDDLAQYFRVLHRPTVTLHDQAEAGDRVWTRLTVEGLNLETGEPRRMSWLQVHRLDHTDRIAETWFLYADGVVWG
jgi:hypothetical protein